MEARKCKYCKSAIPSDKRADSKFCSNSCKANYWEANKNVKKAPENKSELTVVKEIVKLPEKPLEGLRGIIENKPKTDVLNVNYTSNTNDNRVFTPTLIQKETQIYKDALAKKEKAEEEFRRIADTLQKAKLVVQTWKEEYQKLERLSKPNPYKRSNIDIEALENYQNEGFIDSIFRSERIEDLKEKITSMTGDIPKVEGMLLTAKKNYESAVFQLKNTQQYETVATNGNSAISLFKLNLLKKLEQRNFQQEDTFTEQPNSLETTPKYIEPENANEKEPIQGNGKLISSRQLREMNYKCLNFQGKWKDFFGLPAVVFHLAVHGKPGEGKSTFCIQFADYLAKNFGHVVYVSGEEGFSKTLRDKVVNNKIDNPYLFFADISSYEQIRNEIPNNQFHFIFIDSLDTLKIDAVKLRELREHYPQSAFITISQSTKDGKMRGSQEIIHDTDIAAKVEDGMAVTSKNRYHPRGTEFQVFPKQQPEDKTMREPRNLL